MTFEDYYYSSEKKKLPAVGLEPALLAISAKSIRSNDRWTIMIPISWANLKIKCTREARKTMVPKTKQWARAGREPKIMGASLELNCEHND